MGRMGNTFGSRTVGAGHARKVWREVKDQFPAGGVVDNLSDWLSGGIGKIPAGTFCKWEDDSSKGKIVTCFTKAQLTAATEPTYTKVASPTGNPKTKGYYEWDDTNDEYVATNDTSVGEKDYFEQVAAVGVASLGINGATLYDVDIEDGDTVGSETVIYAGEIYSYMIDSDVLALVKDLAALSEIKFVS